MLTVSTVLLVVALGVAAFVGACAMLLALALCASASREPLEPPARPYDDEGYGEDWGGDYASVDGPTMPVPPMAPAMARYVGSTSEADAGLAWGPTISRAPRPWETGPLELQLDQLHTGVEEIEEGPGLWN